MTIKGTIRSKSVMCVWVVYFGVTASAGIPNRLDIEGTEARFTMFQRSSLPVPGSSRLLTLHLEDIKRQSVQVSVTASDGSFVLAPRWMKQGDATTLGLKEETYVLRLENLVNLLLANDYVTFSIVPETIKNRVDIERLIVQVEQSELIFLRNREKLNGPQLAAQMRQKWAELGYAITKQELIENLPCRSADAGKPYLVMYPDRSTRHLETWLKFPVRVTPFSRGDADSASAIPSPTSRLECRLGPMEFEELLDRIRNGDEVFLFLGNQFLVGEDYARFLALSTHQDEGNSNCLERIVDDQIRFFEQFGDDYQVKRSDGRVVRTSEWLKSLADVIRGQECRSNPR